MRGNTVFINNSPLRAAMLFILNVYEKRIFFWDQVR